MWETENIDIGRCKEKETITVLFKFKLPLPEGFKIEEMASSCGCSTPMQTKEGIEVKYTPQVVPPQLETKAGAKGEYSTHKNISVQTNAGHFILRINGIIYKDR